MDGYIYEMLNRIEAKLDYLVNEVEQAKKANKKGADKDAETKSK